MVLLIPQGILSGVLVLGVMPRALALEGIFDAAVCKTAERFYKYRKVVGGVWFWGVSYAKAMGARG